MPIHAVRIPAAAAAATVPIHPAAACRLLYPIHRVRALTVHARVLGELREDRHELGLERFKALAKSRWVQLGRRQAGQGTNDAPPSRHS